MKQLYPILLFCLFFACQPNTEKTSHEQADSPSTIPQYVLRPDFQQLIDSNLLEGGIFIYDALRQIHYASDTAYGHIGRLPASTFKIPNSIVALETGVMASDSSISKWDGQPRAFPSWEADLTLKQAFHRSCVPCYQEIARKVGLERMRATLDRLQYPGMRFDSSSLDLFWLTGPSRISPYQQLEFLQRLYEARLDISERTHRIIRRMMVVEETDQYRLSGKTGWAMRDNYNNGWYVGYLEKGDAVYYFATNVSPSPTFNMDKFSAIRKQLAMEALQKLGLLPPQ